MSLREVLLGRPLRTTEEQVEQVGALTAVPAMGLDALASAAYGPEAALTVLLPLGLGASRYITGISLAVTVVLLAVYFSYRQTIPAYPHGGGSYTVAKENLGPLPGLMAATALCLDYLLNVAVAIAAGVGAVVSMVPALLPHTLPLCLAILALLTLVNLRGVRSAGIVFLTPTYVFVACMVVAIGFGAAELFSGTRAPVHAATASTTAGAWLVLRSFASGCTALTGVEAVSNAVPVFREPRVMLARRTLTVIVLILGSLLVGIAFLAPALGITATPPGQAGYQSVLSQLVHAVSGRGPFYYLTMSATVAVLALSANTSFTDFPRVCRLLALDRYLPASFARRGHRLVYTSGILVLAGLSGALLVAFGGVTDRLIPLFAVGAFTAFTLSQLGMVIHWKRRPGRGARRSLVINAVGATATAATLVIIIVSKFTEGAWLTLLAFPALLQVFRLVQRHHDKLERAPLRRVKRQDAKTPPDL